MRFTIPGPSAARIGAKWLLLCLAFCWLVGCAGIMGKPKAARDPFAAQKFKCGEEKPSGATSAPLTRG